MEGLPLRPIDEELQMWISRAQHAEDELEKLQFKHMPWIFIREQILFDGRRTGHYDGRFFFWGFAFNFRAKYEGTFHNGSKRGIIFRWNLRNVRGY